MIDILAKLVEAGNWHGRRQGMGHILPMLQHACGASAEDVEKCIDLLTESHRPHIADAAEGI